MVEEIQNRDHELFLNLCITNCSDNECSNILYSKTYNDAPSEEQLDDNNPLYKNYDE